MWKSGCPGCFLKKIGSSNMKNTEIRIFYSWQSDLPNSETRGLIQDSISSAVKMLRDTVEIEADRDTKGEYGSPDIVQTIFSKIDECDIFIADVSIVNKYSSITDEGENGNVRYGPNPNVMLELGYAASVVGWENVICILDTDYGSPDDLPFDLAHHRLSPYSLKEKTKKDVKKYIRDIITDTVSNLLENGPRVKSNFSNLVVGCYNQESNEITKEAWSYSPFEYFDSVIKDRGIAGCKQLISEINDIHLEPCIVEEPKEQPQVSSNISEMLGSINLFGDTPQRVIITEKEKESIISFSMEYPEIKLMDDFFELGNLKKKVSFHIGGSGTTYEGTEEEKLKYEKINELDYRIAQMQMMEMYSRTFDDYFLFPLAIRNVSTIADDEISISVTRRVSEPFIPSYPPQCHCQISKTAQRCILFFRDRLAYLCIVSDNSYVFYLCDPSFLVASRMSEPEKPRRMSAATARSRSCGSSGSAPPYFFSINCAQSAGKSTLFIYSSAASVASPR